MSFIIYDLTFLAIFVIFVATFLFLRRKNLQREGLLFLYRTSWGLKLIDYVGKKYKRTLKVLSYVSVSLGYVLMAVMLYLFYNIIKIYIFEPSIVRAIKVPPIMPLVPYIDKLVPGLPAFNFTYWIVILAIIAITHEFAHGIFAAHNGVKTKTTGFGFFPFFLPVFLAAFVELDEEKMEKKSNFAQMSVLSAGTFANVLTAIFFFIVMVIFFKAAFVSQGIVFDSYAYDVIGVGNVTSINGFAVDNATYENIAKVIDMYNITEINSVMVGGTLYKGMEFFSDDDNYVKVYFNAPAINAHLEKTLVSIDGVELNNTDDLSQELLKYKPGDTIILGVYDGEDVHNEDITLNAYPSDKDRAWLGIIFFDQEATGVKGKILAATYLFKTPHTNYVPKYDGISEFIYNLLWWLVLISISVALVNMLPVGIFDGGRFFYLTILSLTKSKEKAKLAFKMITYLFLILLAVIMVFWLWSFV